MFTRSAELARPAIWGSTCQGWFAKNATNLVWPAMAMVKPIARFAKTLWSVRLQTSAHRPQVPAAVIVTQKIVICAAEARGASCASQDMVDGSWLEIGYVWKWLAMLWTIVLQAQICSEPSAKSAIIGSASGWEIKWLAQIRRIWCWESRWCSLLWLLAIRLCKGEIFGGEVFFLMT